MAQSKYIELKFSDGEILRIDSSELNTPSVVITSMMAQSKESELKLESLPIVCKYPDVLREELPGLPPIREVEFGIKLVPGTTPISIAPYRMKPYEALYGRKCRTPLGRNDIASKPLPQKCVGPRGSKLDRVGALTKRRRFLATETGSKRRRIWPFKRAETKTVIQTLAPQSFLLNRNLIPPSVRISRGPSRHLTTLNGDRRREICTLPDPAWVLTLRASDFSPYTPSRLQLKQRRRGFRRFVLIGSFSMLYCNFRETWFACFYPALLQLQRDKDCDFDLLHYNLRETRFCNFRPVALLLRGLRLIFFDLLHWRRDLQSPAYSTTTLGR
ncbi:uncharacterized protein [Gossypium hirsutum]|uniref:Uncharacterized protein n=1 Tax=Gossypium hirsutum TaxID=3635 RepID=A0ABM2YXP5_GOSHI|nr:uncharacterized protein LOC121207963 [Gossypium hirsutum]